MNSAARWTSSWGIMTVLSALKQNRRHSHPCRNAARVLALSIRTMWTGKEAVMGDYRKLWILLREQLTRQENESEKYSIERDVIHNVLTRMSEMDAAEFLED